METPFHWLCVCFSGNFGVRKYKCYVCVQVTCYWITRMAEDVMNRSGSGAARNLNVMEAIGGGVSHPLQLTTGLVVNSFIITNSHLGRRA